jgi:glycosyltransferase involved in cell wall biosynthesis
MPKKSLPISVMVAGCNEARFLKQCLESVSFCDEIIYIDLESADNSMEIASNYANKILQKEKKGYPSGEYVHAEIVNETSHNWVIFIDPDERIDAALTSKLREIFPVLQSSGSIGAVLVPWVFYFKNRQLRGTVWGGNNKKFLLVNKQRFDFLPITHYGRKLKEGFDCLEIDESAMGGVLHHYWTTSIRKFLDKHQRYLKKEGIDQYNAGLRVSAKSLLTIPFQEFKRSFVTSKGYRDGVVGLTLSIFWAYYKTYSAIDLFLIQRRSN